MLMLKVDYIRKKSAFGVLYHKDEWPLPFSLMIPLLLLDTGMLCKTLTHLWTRTNGFVIFNKMGRQPTEPDK